MKKILKLEDLEQVIKKVKSESKSIVLAGGCFDILHKGHEEFLSAAKTFGDHLIILLESDQRVTELKGKNRPINSIQTRAHALAQIQSIDSIILLPPLKNNLEYLFLVKTIKPDIIAITHGDPGKSIKLAHAKEVKARLIEVMQRLPEYSTTKIVESRNI